MMVDDVAHRRVQTLGRIPGPSRCVLSGDRDARLVHRADTPASLATEREQPKRELCLMTAAELLREPAGRVIRLSAHGERARLEEPSIPGKRGAEVAGQPVEEKLPPPIDPTSAAARDRATVSERG